MDLFMIFAFAAAGMSAVGCYVFWRRKGFKTRREFIENYIFPSDAIVKLSRHYKHLGADDGQLVAQALRQFFVAWLLADFKPIAMPSRSTDVLWHEFILHTKQYEEFCRRAFGRFLHHSPAKEMAVEFTPTNAHTMRAWTQCCRVESLNPYKPSRLPQLFAVDAILNIPDGFHYDLETVENIANAYSGGGRGGGGCGGG